MFQFILLIFTADPVFTVENKCPVAFVVENKIAATPSLPTAPQTTVCQCRGTNRGVCQCLRAGVTCKCSAAVGSVWTVGTPPKKTGEYRNPATMAATAKPTAETKPQPAMAAPVAQAPVATPRASRYKLVCNGRFCQWVLAE